MPAVDLVWKNKGKILNQVQDDMLYGVQEDMLSGAKIDMLCGAQVDTLGGAQVDTLGGAQDDMLYGAQVDMLSGAKIDMLCGAQVDMLSGAKIDMLCGAQVDMLSGTRDDGKEQRRAERGHAVLMSVLITTLVLVILLIPLQIMMTKTVRNTIDNASSRQVSYASEAGVHDLVARVYKTAFTWPGVGGDPTSDTSTVGEVDLQRGVTQNTATNVTIDVAGEFNQVQRAFEASTQQVYDSADYPVDVVISIDASQSMDNLTPGCSDAGADVCEPLNAAREAAKTLVDNILAESPYSTLTVQTFADYAQPLSGVTFSNDPNIVKNAIDTVKILPRNGTNVGDAVAVAQQALDGQVTAGREGVIVLLTDGSTNYRGSQGSTVACEGQPVVHSECTIDTNALSASSRATAAKDAGYEIYTIGLSLSDLEPIAHEMVARETLYEVSSTPAHYFDSASPENLQAAYTSIASNIIQKIRFVITEIK